MTDDRGSDGQMKLKVRKRQIREMNNETSQERRDGEEQVYQTPQGMESWCRGGSRIYS